MKTSSTLNYICEHKSDILTAFFIAFICGYLSYQGSQLIDPIVFDRNTKNLWFDADLDRVFANMTIRESNHYRTNVHPLFSSVAYFSVFLVKNILAIDSIVAVRIVIAIVASVWIMTLFTLLRLIGCRCFDALIFSVLAATSAAAFFWFIVPETYPFGSLSILLALVFVVLSERQQFPISSYIAVTAMTFSMTVTNCMVGILTTIVNHPWRRSIVITLTALFSISMLSALQMFIFSRARLPLFTRTETDYLLAPESGGPIQVLKSFTSHTVVMPAINIIEQWDKYENRDWVVISTQSSSPGSATIWGTAAVILWIALLSLGLWIFFSTKKHPKLRFVLGISLLGQLGLHILYGTETFLYSLHFVPFLIVLAAFSTLTTARPAALSLAFMLIVTTTINNWLQLAKVREIIAGIVNSLN